MRHFFLTIAIIGALLGGAYYASGAASAGQHTHDIPLRCTEHIDSSGNASIGHCHTLPSRIRHLPWAMRHDCGTDNQLNCYVSHGGDGGSHPHYRVATGTMLCVYFSGTPGYQANHNYCTQL